MQNVTIFFIIFLPTRSVCGFEAFINGKHIVGKVKEKEQARQEYKEAISKGHGAYLMEEQEEQPVRNRTERRTMHLFFKAHFKVTVNVGLHFLQFKFLPGIHGFHN